MKTMVMAERLANNKTLVIMQLGDTAKRLAMLSENVAIISPLVRDKVGVFFNRQDCEHRMAVLDSCVEYGSQIAESVKQISREASKYGFGCKVGDVGDLGHMLASENTHLVFVAPTYIVDFITGGVRFNKHYALNVDTGVLDELKDKMKDYSTSEMVDAMIADL